MITPVETMEIVAFTRPDEFDGLGDRGISFAYQRVVGLWHRDGSFGRHIGREDTRGRDERVLSLSPLVGSRLMNCFSAIIEGQEVNCHRFSREISGMPLANTEPIVNFHGLPVVEHLPEGSMGVIGISGYGVPHSIGYGLGDESLQVMSPGGELGFANNKYVIEFYRQTYQDNSANLYLVQ
jgi:hypothetical protein